MAVFLVSGLALAVFVSANTDSAQDVLLSQVEAIAKCEATVTCSGETKISCERKKDGTCSSDNDDKGAGYVLCSGGGDPDVKKNCSFFNS